MKKRKRQCWIYLLVAIIFVSCFYGRFDIEAGFVPNCAYADNSSEESLEEELESEVDEQLSNLDFSSIENILAGLSDSTKELFSGSSFVEKLRAVISGEYVDSSESFFSSVLALFWGGLQDFLPIIASIIAISSLGGMIGNLKPTSNGKSIGNIVHFVTYGVIIIFLGHIFI